MIVVLDTNVAVSALHFAARRGVPVRALEKAASFDLIATCEEIEDEIARILIEKFRWNSVGADREMRVLFRNALRVELRGTVHVCRDPGDDMILECAERAGADLIVTGDQDLLSLGRFGKTEIVTPAEYLAR